ncbi:MAG: alpha/beta hydrolase [Ignisphaera sp.]
MRFEVIKLRDDRPVKLYTYILDLSPQIAWGKRPAVIICPGGSFLYTSDREAEPVAMAFLSKGYHAFVLRYTTTDMGVKKVYPDIIYDLANALTLIRHNTNEWGIDPDKIAIIGFSAGGALAALYSVNWHRDWLSSSHNVSKENLKPNAVILAYPAALDYITMYEALKKRSGSAVEVFHRIISALLGAADIPVEKLKEVSAVYHVDQNTPPTFIWSTADDSIVPVESIITYVKALVEKGVPFELHIFDKGVHGLSLANRTTARNPEQINLYVSKWVELALNWLDKQFEVNP